MKKLIIYSILVIIVLLISCEKEIPFKGNELDPKITLYSNLHPDSIIACDIGLSYPVNQSNYNPTQIKNAEVKLFIDGSFAENLSYVPEPLIIDDYQPENYLSRYISTQLPVPGKEYSLEVELNGFSSISGSGSLPQNVPIIRLDTQRIIMNDYGYTYPVLETKMVFKDPEKTENFYRLVFKTTSGFYAGDKSFPYDPVTPVLVSTYLHSWIDSNDPILFPSEEEGLFEESEGNEYLIFSDEKIDGKEYELKFKLSFDGLIPDPDFYEFFHYEVNLQSISKDLYYYLKSSGAQKYNDGNLFVEPVLVFSNIKNGLGLFGTTNSDSYVLKVGEYPVNGIYYENPEDYYIY